MTIPAHQHVLYLLTSVASWLQRSDTSSACCESQTPAKSTKNLATSSNPSGVAGCIRSRTCQTRQPLTVGPRLPVVANQNLRRSGLVFRDESRKPDTDSSKPATQQTTVCDRCVIGWGWLIVLPARRQTTSYGRQTESARHSLCQRELQIGHDASNALDQIARTLNDIDDLSSISESAQPTTLQLKQRQST